MNKLSVWTLEVYLKQPIKPVVLLKSQKIADSEAFYDLFFEKLHNLSGQDISALNIDNNPVLNVCFASLLSKIAQISKCPPVIARLC